MKAFGCSEHEIDGHDYQEFLDALTSIADNKPAVIVANTIKGKGVSFMENRVEWHYKNPNNDQLALALAELEVKNV